MRVGVDRALRVPVFRQPRRSRRRAVDHRDSTRRRGRRPAARPQGWRRGSRTRFRSSCRDRGSAATPVAGPITLDLSPYFFDAASADRTGRRDRDARRRLDVRRVPMHQPRPDSRRRVSPRGHGVGHIPSARLESAPRSAWSATCFRGNNFSYVVVEPDGGDLVRDPRRVVEHRRGRAGDSQRLRLGHLRRSVHRPGDTHAADHVRCSDGDAQLPGS